MFLKCLVHIQLLTTFTVDCMFLEVKPQIRKKQNMNNICYNVTKDPFYLKTLVVGKPRHAYVSWNLQYGEKCFKMIFKVPDNMNEIVRDLKNKCNGLYEQPRWSRAETLLSMGKFKEMVLFRDRSGVPGQFDGIPYYQNDVVAYALRKPYKMTIKVFEKGKYILLADCTSGLILLLLHPKERPKRVQIEAFAAMLHLGNPSPACINEPDPVKNNVTKVTTQKRTKSTKKISKYDW